MYIKLKENETMQDLADGLARSFELVNDIAPVAYWYEDLYPNGRIIGIHFSNHLREMLGYKSEEEFPDNLDSFKSFLHPDDVQPMLDAAIAAGTGKTDGYDIRYRIRKKDGSYLWARATGEIVIDFQGTTVGMYGGFIDVTPEMLLEEQQKQLTEALAAANKEKRRTDTLYEIVHSGKWSMLLDAEDNIYNVDNAADANQIAKYNSVADGVSWMEPVHPDDREYVSEAFFGAVRDHSCRTPFDVNYRFKGSDGVYRWLHSAGRVIRNEDGTGEFFGILADVTDRMEEHRKRLLGAVPLSNDVLNKANIGLWAFELDEGKPPRMYDDETMLGLVGLDRQVPPEEAYHAWYDHIDEGSYDLVTDAVARMIAGEHAEVQYPWHFPDGRTIIVRCGGVRNFEYTKGIRIEGTHQDVTQTLHFDEEERKRAKQLENDLIISKLRADSLAYISDNEPDLDKALNFFGNRILELYGCDQVIFREPGGRKIVMNAPGIEAVPETICVNCPFARFDCEAFKDTGSVLMDDCSTGYKGIFAPDNCPAKSSFMQMVYSGGELAGKLTIHYLKNYHTFTENGIDIMKTVAVYLGLLIGRIKEKQAEMARLSAESANRAKTEFLFNMSHDIRTPMNAILGYTDIGLRHAAEPEKSKDSYMKIKAAGGHLLNLINDILEMSRIESGKFELSESPVDVRMVSRDIQYMSESLAAPKSIDMRIEIGNLKNPYIYADVLHVSEIVINLISNAVKYTPEDGRVIYRVEQISGVTDGKAAYRFEVSDNGIGMSEEFREHLFEAFSREQTTTVSGIEGTGLGLSIVKQIVDISGGTISVRSKQNEGSTFTVELPFRVMDEAAIEKFRASDRGEDEFTEDISLVGKRVLLVEDNEMNREIATELLEESGLLVETAENGEAAVRAVLNKGINHYDFILMDIQMPVMNGYQATGAIRALPDGGNIPIIALSANAFEEDRQKSLSAGMNAHIAKPVNIKELFGTLVQYL